MARPGVFYLQPANAPQLYACCGHSLKSGLQRLFHNTHMGRIRVQELIRRGEKAHMPRPEKNVPRL